MIDALKWYLIVSIAGWLVVPLAQRLFRFLPDRGYTLARPLAMILWGYIFWLLTYLHILQNDPGGVLLALFILAGLSFVFGRGQLKGLWTWIKEQRRLVLVTEVLFLLAFALWVFVRAANPDVNYTEKPMELGFLNAIMRSPGFPPNDPWLSGYAISYYYFGYIIVAMLVHLSGTATQIGFNLAVAMWFALTAVAAYGIVYNLLVSRQSNEDKPNLSGAAYWALLAPLFILIVGNLSGFLDVLHARGLFWQSDGGGLQSNFWTWLNIKELNVPPPQPYSWMPHRGGWLWWMGSRVVQDFSMTGASLEVIDEFPFFSYLLADLHPHVLGMPFVLLAIGLALNLGYRGLVEKIKDIKVGAALKSFDFWPTVIILGGLAFLNTWDFPIYVALVAAVYVWLRTMQNGWNRRRLVEFVKLGLLLGIAGGLLYLPFYIGFASQAGGLLPSLAFQTRGVYFLVMFLPLLLPIGVWLINRMAGRDQRSDLKIGLIVGGAVTAGLWVLMIALGGLFQLGDAVGTDWASSATLVLQSFGSRIAQGLGEFYARQGGSGWELLKVSIQRRLTDPLTWLLSLGLIALGWGLLSYSRKQNTVSDPQASEAEAENNPVSTSVLRIDEGFAAILILIGAVLTIFPEFFYLRDGFGTRMNTIFKFYFQAWIIWGIAAAYTTAVLWKQLRGVGKFAFQAVWSLMLIAALAYPAVNLYAKTGIPGKPLSELTLDGKRYLQLYNPDEWAAFEWLKTAPSGVVVETVGASYIPDTSRVSTHTGLQTVLGWQGHEWQWRGGAEEIGSRAGEIEVLYSTDSWEEAAQICARYNIRYIYIGPVERINYRISERKFQTNLPVVFQNKGVTIYEVPGYNPQPVPLSDAVIP